MEEPPRAGPGSVLPGRAQGEPWRWRSAVRGAVGGTLPFAMLLNPCQRRRELGALGAGCGERGPAGSGHSGCWRAPRIPESARAASLCSAQPLQLCCAICRAMAARARCPPSASHPCGNAALAPGLPRDGAGRGARDGAGRGARDGAGRGTRGAARKGT